MVRIVFWNANARMEHYAIIVTEVACAHLVGLVYSVTKPAHLVRMENSVDINVCVRMMECVIMCLVPASVSLDG